MKITCESHVFWQCCLDKLLLGRQHEATCKKIVRYTAISICNSKILQTRWRAFGTVWEDTSAHVRKGRRGRGPYLTLLNESPPPGIFRKIILLPFILTRIRSKPIFVFESYWQGTAAAFLGLSSGRKWRVTFLTEGYGFAAAPGRSVVGGWGGCL